MSIIVIVSALPEMPSENRKKKQNCTGFSMYLDEYIRRHARHGIPAMSKQNAVPGARVDWNRMTQTEKARYVSPWLFLGHTLELTQSLH
jgi:hypothetical protein